VQKCKKLFNVSKECHIHHVYLEDVFELAHVGRADVPADAALAHDLNPIKLLANVFWSGLASGIYTCEKQNLPNLYNFGGQYIVIFWLPRLFYRTILPSKYPVKPELATTYKQRPIRNSYNEGGRKHNFEKNHLSPMRKVCNSFPEGRRGCCSCGQPSPRSCSPPSRSPSPFRGSQPTRGCTLSRTKQGKCWNLSLNTKQKSC